MKCAIADLVSNRPACESAARVLRQLAEQADQGAIRGVFVVIDYGTEYSTAQSTHMRRLELIGALHEAAAGLYRERE